MNEDSVVIYRFHTDLLTSRSGMIYAGQALRMGVWRQSLMAILTALSLGLLVIGGATAGFMLSIIAGMEPTFFSLSVAAGVLLGVMLAIGWYDRLIKIMAGAVIETPFNQGEQEFRFDAQGVTLLNPHACWRTDWSGINGLKGDQTGLHIFVSGIVLSVPFDTVGGTDSMSALTQRLDAWHKAGGVS